MSGTDEPVVLVVEDEPDVGETYELWLAGDYEVRRASTGTEALEALDEDVDVVLLLEVVLKERGARADDGHSVEDVVPQDAVDELHLGRPGLQFVGALPEEPLVDRKSVV